jgi:hypothetical protein
MFRTEPVLSTAGATSVPDRTQDRPGILSTSSTLSCHFDCQSTTILISCTLLLIGWSIKLSENAKRRTLRRNRIGQHTRVVGWGLGDPPPRCLTMVATISRPTSLALFSSSPSCLVVLCSGRFEDPADCLLEQSKNTSTNHHADEDPKKWQKCHG